MNVPGEAATAEAMLVFRRILFSRNIHDPYPLYAQLRDKAPVLRSSMPGVAGGVVLSRYAECSVALRHHALLPLGMHESIRQMRDWPSESALGTVYQSLVWQYGQAHARVRHRLGSYFTTTRVQGLREFVTATAERCLDDLAARQAGPEGLDLVAELSLPYPLAVISWLFGVEPRTARPLARSGRLLAGALEPLQSRSTRRQMDTAAREWIEYFRAALGRADHGDDLLFALSRPDADGGVLDERDLLANLIFGFTAGYDSATSFLSTAIKTLLDHPEQAALLRNDPALAPRAAAELLRFVPPVHATFRIAAEPLRLGDLDLPERAQVWILLASANRDARQVENPDRLDITRLPSPTLTFGAGAHFCVGARLARMEAEILLPRVLRRFPRMRLAGTPGYRVPGTVLHGVDHLPVVLDGDRGD
jgi:cytochrome P450